MGNQGMTNWKFSAFFAIALILVAGMFASTAIAADGDGQVSVAWRIGETGSIDQSLDTDGSGSLDSGDVYLPAGSEKNALQFTYSLTSDQDDMALGIFQITIPRAWVIAEVIEIDEDGTTIFRKGRDTDAEDDGDNDLNTDDRTTVTKIGDDVSVVKVKLGATPEADAP